MGNARETKLIDEDIDLMELAENIEQPLPTENQKKAVAIEAKKTGFVSREPRKMGRHRTSPYTAQFGGKCREGMKPLFQRIGEQLDCHDTVTLELAILALIEKEGLSELKAEHKRITNR